MSKATRMLKASESTKWTKKRLKKLGRFAFPLNGPYAFIRIKRVHFKKGWHPKIPCWPNYDRDHIGLTAPRVVFYTN